MRKPGQREVNLLAQTPLDGKMWSQDSNPHFLPPGPGTKFDMELPSRQSKIGSKIKYILNKYKPPHVFLFNLYLFILEREREREICCSTYSRIHWLILACALTGDQTHSLVISERCSKQLSHPARASTCSFKVMFL